MKNIMMTSIAALFVASSAMAADFDSNTLSFVLHRDNVKIEAETVAGDLTKVSAGVYVLPHVVGGFDANVFASVGYLVGPSTAVVGLDYNLSRKFDNNVGLYATLGTEYTISSGTTKGNWTVEPLVGVSYSFTNDTFAFGEVSYKYDASNSFNKLGGAVEIGLDHKFNDVLSGRLSLVKDFDKAVNDTNIKAVVAVAF